MFLLPDRAERQGIMKFRKTYYYDRTDYTYTDADGHKVTLHVGDFSPIDGQPVTAEIIKLLHSMDDAEVYNNLKNSRPPMTEAEKQAAREWEEKHPGETAPRNWNISLDLYFGDDDSDMDRSTLMNEIAKRSQEEHEPESRHDEIIEQMPEKTRIACTLVWKEGYSQVEAAKIMGCSKVNVNKLIKRAEEIIKNNL